MNYKADLTEANEAPERCRKCGTLATLYRKHGRERRYYCAACYLKTSHRRRTAYHPTIDQSPVALTPADIIGALEAGAVRGSVVADILEKLEKR